MEQKLTIWQLRDLNGDFGCACQIGADRLASSEVKNLTNGELTSIKSRLSNERLLVFVNKEIKRRKLN